MALFSATDRARIEGRIKSLEAHSRGEVVVASVPRSDDYATPRWLFALLLSIAVIAVTYHLWPTPSVDELLLAQLPLAGLFYALCGLPVVVRVLVSKASRNAAVQARAARMFAERKVFATQEATGVLIMLSELERRVTILADRGIHQRVEHDGWQRHIEHVVTAIRAGRAADGVCEVLDDLDALLAQAFPPHPEDRDELPNQVVEET